MKAGLTVLPVGTAGCLPTRLSYSVQTASTEGSGPGCSGEGSQPCDSSGKRHFRKSMQFRMYDPNREGVVFEAVAKMATDNPSFTDVTAYAMCEATFAEFPRRMVGRSYLIDLPEH